MDRTAPSCPLLGVTTLPACTLTGPAAHAQPPLGEWRAFAADHASTKYSGLDTNVWSWMSCDEELGYVYLPLGTPSDAWYGGHRLGDNLFAESLVALDAYALPD